MLIHLSDRMLPAPRRAGLNFPCSLIRFWLRAQLTLILIYFLGSVVVRLTNGTLYPQPVIRLYAVPMNAFTGEEDDEDFDGEDGEGTA